MLSKKVQTLSQMSSVRGKCDMICACAIHGNLAKNTGATAWAMKYITAACAVHALPPAPTKSCAIRDTTTGCWLTAAPHFVMMSTAYEKNGLKYNVDRCTYKHTFPSCRPVPLHATNDFLRGLLSHPDAGGDTSTLAGDTFKTGVRSMGSEARGAEKVSVLPRPVLGDFVWRGCIIGKKGFFEKKTPVFSK